MAALNLQTVSPAETEQSQVKWQEPNALFPRKETYFPLVGRFLGGGVVDLRPHGRWGGRWRVSLQVVADPNSFDDVPQILPASSPP